MATKRAIAVAVSLVCASASAHAGPVRVLVWPREPGVRTSAAVAAARAAGAQVVPFAPIANRLSERGAQAAKARERMLDAIQGDLAAVRAAFLAQQFDDMAAIAQRAFDSALALPPADHATVLWELAFQTGVAHVARGDGDAAQTSFSLALSLAPDRRPPVGVYGPDVAAAFGAAVTARQTTPARPVGIDVVPADARVFVDGTPVVDPSRQLSLVPGHHVAFAAAPGYQTRALIVDMAAAQTVNLRLEARAEKSAIDRVGAAWSRGEVSPDLVSGRQVIAAVAREVGATAVLVVDTDRKRGGATASLLVGSDAAPPARASRLDAAARLALARLAPDGSLRQSAVVGAQTMVGGERDTSSLWSRWWFWTAVGVVATAAATTVGVVVQSEPDRIRILAPPP